MIDSFFINTIQQYMQYDKLYQSANDDLQRRMEGDNAEDAGLTLLRR